MKTRVVRFYDIPTGVWIYTIECWYPIPIGWFAGESEVQHFWWPWPFKPGVEAKPSMRIFQTPDVVQARRIAQEVSAGVPIDAHTVCEFSDGVEFKVPI